MLENEGGDTAQCWYEDESCVIHSRPRHPPHTNAVGVCYALALPQAIAFALKAWKQPQVCRWCLDLRENCLQSLAFNCSIPPISHLCPRKACGEEQVEGWAGYLLLCWSKYNQSLLQSEVEVKLLREINRPLGLEALGRRWHSWDPGVLGCAEIPILPQLTVLPSIAASVRTRPSSL